MSTSSELVAPHSLDTIPLEVLQRIVDFLEADGQMGSAVALASSSKHCYSAAKDVLHRTIKIQIPEEGQGHLPREVEMYRYMLQRDGLMGQVRRLVIGGRDPPLDETSQSPEASRSLEQRYLDWQPPAILIRDRIEDEDSTKCRRLYWSILDKEDENLVEVDCTDMDTAAVYRTDKAWQPLASLVEELPRLSDLVYSCPGQFPPCMLKALHQYHPHCRLHIHSFFLRSLKEEDPVMEPHELMLASSPCLYSIRPPKLTGPNKESPTHDPHSPQDAGVFHILTSLSRSLKDVITFASRSPGAEVDGGLFEKTLRSLKKSHPWMASGSLTSLQLNCFPPVTEFLELWHRHTDFSVLRVLKIPTWVTSEDLRYLQDCSFPSLITLVIFFEDLKSAEEKKEYYDMATRFIGNLPVLRNLRMKEWCPDYPLSPILGANLRTLKLEDSVQRSITYGLNHVEEICARCPALQDLEIPIRRSKGDATEVALYRAIGRIPKLRNLTINLIVLPSAKPRSEDSSGNIEGEQQSQDVFARPQLRDFFINSAIDETLVRTIFNVISTARGTCLPTPSALEVLELHVFGVHNFDPYINGYLPYMLAYFTNLAMPWRVKRTRNSRNECGRGLVVKPLKNWQKMYGRPFRVVRIGRRDPDTDFRVEDCELHPTFRSIWPAQSGSGHETRDSWCNDWQSFPLALDT